MSCTTLCVSSTRRAASGTKAVAIVRPCRQRSERGIMETATRAERARRRRSAIESLALARRRRQTSGAASRASRPRVSSSSRADVASRPRSITIRFATRRMKACSVPRLLSPAANPRFLVPTSLLARPRKAARAPPRTSFRGRLLPLLRSTTTTMCAPIHRASPSTAARRPIWQATRLRVGTRAKTRDKVSHRLAARGRRMHQPHLMRRRWAASARAERASLTRATLA